MSNTKLVAVSKPSIDGCNVAEQLVVYCARVSSPHNQENFDTSAKLLAYMIDHEHWSPFEMVSLTIEIECTRDIGRQILRHRSFSFQEFSQRYAEVQPGSLISRETRKQDTANRQNSLEITDSLEDKQLDKWWSAEQIKVKRATAEAYTEAIKKGVAKEQARAVLPEGMTMTKIYMSGTLRSWIHYCKLRCGNGTQKEHRLIAEECRTIVLKEFPSLKRVLIPVKTD